MIRRSHLLEGALAVLAATGCGAGAGDRVAPAVADTIATGAGTQRGAAPAIDRRYIAVAALGMQPLSRRPRIPVTSYGAKGDGATDDTAAIQRAFDRVPSGDVLLFPAGTYRYSGVLTLRKRNVVVEGSGATLQALSPENESLVMQGDETALVGMTIDGTGAKRLTTPQSTDVEVTGRYVQIVANAIAGGASAGIFMYGARDYRITGNVVRDTLADGIHSTNASRRGLIEGNRVFRSGDDTIAVVSYTGERPSGDILINDNHVSGNPWGRGITCVGCTDVVIVNNAISDVACCAGVYVSNEIETIGVDGVLVRNDDVSRIELTTPCCGSQTGQGGIDVNAVGTYPVRYVSIEDDRVAHAADDGIRVLDYGGPGSVFEHINVEGNRIYDTGSTPLAFVDAPGVPSATTCWGNRYDGKPFAVAPAQCAAERVTAAQWKQFNFADPEGMTWSPDGRPVARPWLPGPGADRSR